MILELRHLRLAAAVAEHGSLTRAGRVLHLTQSALSHQLLDLEARLRVTLFHRMGKRMVPTAAGVRLLEAARQTLPTLVAAEEELRRLAAGREAILRLSTECYTCYHWLPRVLERFRVGHPRVEVQIVPEATRRPIAALLDGRIDLGIATGTERDERLEYHPLFQDEMVAVMTPEHRLASRSYLRAEDFAAEHLIMYTIPESESTLFRTVLVPAGVRPAKVSLIELTEAIVELVRAGVGIAVLARWAVSPQLESGVLRAVPVTRRGIRRRWYAATVRQKSPPDYLRAFTRLLADGPAGFDRGQPAA
jgi:LysR family transcriptional regulator for metE and metH